jgi:magnesium transporter
VDTTAAQLGSEILYLLEQRRFRDVRKALKDVPPADVAETLALLEPEPAASAFRLLPRDQAGEAFADLEHDHQETLIEALGAKARLIVEAMEPDDRAEMLDELPHQVARRLIAALDAEDRQVTQAILGYPADSVGRLMTPDYVRIRSSWTIARALEHVREYGSDAETVTWVYITGEGGRLIDDVHIRKLLLADPETPVQSLLDDRFTALNAWDDREQAVRVMGRYHRTALPVVDSRGVLLGIVTSDDVAEVAEEEVTEDIQKLAGMDALQAPYMRAPFGEMLKKRGGWLVLLFLGQMASVAVLGYFEEHLAKVLVLFIPMIIASGGNTGTQASSLLIRALALQELRPGDWWRVVRKELATGLCLGLVLGVCGVGGVLFWNALGVANTLEPFRVGLAVGAAILGIVVWAVLLGALFPLLLDKLGLDPATISSPLVATLMDVSGLVIYLMVASTILEGRVL